MSSTPLAPSTEQRQALYSHLVLLHEFVQKATHEATGGEAQLVAASEQLATIAENQLKLRQHLDTATASISIIGDIIGLDPAAELGSGPHDSAFANAAEHEEQEPKPRYDGDFRPGLGRDPLTLWEFPPLEITTDECTDIATGALPGWFVQPSTLLTQRALPGEPTGVGTLPGIPSGRAASTAAALVDISDADENEAQLDEPSFRPSRRPRESRNRSAKSKPPALVDYEPTPRPSAAKRFRMEPSYRSSASSQSSQGAGYRSRRAADALAIGQATAILSTIAASLGSAPDEDCP